MSFPPPQNPSWGQGNQLPQASFGGNQFPQPQYSTTQPNYPYSPTQQNPYSPNNNVPYGNVAYPPQVGQYSPTTNIPNQPFGQVGPTSAPLYSQNPQNNYGNPQSNYQNPQPQRPQQGWLSSFYNQISPQEMANLQSWFNSVDADKSGTISAQELAAMKYGPSYLGLPAAKKLIKVFDKHYTGTIDFHEFASLHQFLHKMYTAFYQADAAKTGLLDAREIHSGLQTGGFQLGLQTVQAICSKFDTTGRGITFEQFLQVCAHLATVRSIFEWNDQGRTGKVVLTYDQLAHVTVHLMDN